METPQVIPPPSRLGSPYTWDARLNHGRGGFRDGRGRAASWRSVRGWLDGYIASAQEEARGVATDIAEGRLTLAEGELRMRALMTNAHLAAGVLERGGWQQMSPADYGRIGQRVRFHLEKLRERFRKIETGAQALDGTLAQRLMAYVQTARATYHRAEIATMKRLGFDEARRVRHAHDSCTTREGKEGRQGCRELAALGWVPIDEVVPIGEATCVHNCLCSITYRRTSDGAELESPERREV